MSALFSILLGGLILLAAGVRPFVVGVACAGTLIAYGALACWSIWCDYRYVERKAHAAFVREVVRQHKRAAEARQATERT